MTVNNTNADDAQDDDETESTDEDSMEAEHVLTINPEISDESLSVDSIEGLREAVERIQDAGEGVEYVYPDEWVDYKVYWNESTESVRIGVLAMNASFEVRDTE